MGSPASHTDDLRMEVIVISSGPHIATEAGAAELLDRAVTALNVNASDRAMVTNALRNVLTIAAHPELVDDHERALREIASLMVRALEAVTPALEAEAS